ncbi:hypothetical protein Pint_07136 [Pistacia integerrima]|uniref:Uncharacterized protein n=1 Tax=Pistacia integerrima TaxID=434235 RepID=A0ACC0XWL8_9ROSI|nr:hypothetical protein Pint_07136 [Pistacia integerrima]
MLAYCLYLDDIDYDFRVLIVPVLYSQGLKCGVTHSEFEIVVPGSQVPDWFIYQRKGPSISISRPMQTCRGLALCAAFSVHDPKGFCPDKWMELDCNIQVTIAPTHAVSETPLNTVFETPMNTVYEGPMNTITNLTVSMSVPPNSLAGIDHLWMFYISRSYLTNNDCFYLSVVSFGDKTDKGITMKIKECGLHPVYDSDIEEFISASNNLSSNTSPEVLDPDRLVVTSTVIKRNRDYCPNQQPYLKRWK